MLRYINTIKKEKDIKKKKERKKEQEIHKTHSRYQHSCSAWRRQTWDGRGCQRGTWLLMRSAACCRTIDDLALCSIVSRCAPVGIVKYRWILSTHYLLSLATSLVIAAASPSAAPLVIFTSASVTDMKYFSLSSSEIATDPIRRSLLHVKMVLNDLEGREWADNKESNNKDERCVDTV